MGDKIVWKTEKRKIGELKPAEYNPRTASEKEKRDLETSLDKFSLADPLIINRNNTLIGGHFRLKVLKEKGLKEIDVRVPNRQLTPDEEKELNLRLNKNSGSWDLELLSNFSMELLADVGFNESEIEGIFDLDLKDDKLPKVDLEGKIEGQTDYIIITFEKDDDGAEARNQLNMAENARSVTFKQVKEKWGIKLP